MGKQRNGTNLTSPSGDSDAVWDLKNQGPRLLSSSPSPAWHQVFWNRAQESTGHCCTSVCGGNSIGKFPIKRELLSIPYKDSGTKCPLTTALLTSVYKNTCRTPEYGVISKRPIENHQGKHCRTEAQLHSGRLSQQAISRSFSCQRYKKTS